MSGKIDAHLRQLAGAGKHTEPVFLIDGSQVHV